ncbi:MAG: adenylate/guanylate cyclase domain-containing protein [Treponema sp.]|nr:adenylate/guanylate cyclase domain-containing protein [Treponema sp.]
MPYSIEFQISGLIVVVVLCIVFFSKPRWQSLQNSIFRVLLPLTAFELLMDIISVITIAERDNIPETLNNFFAKGYIISIYIWITGVALYVLSNFIYTNTPQKNITRIKVTGLLLIIAAAAGCVITIAAPLKYANYGRKIYSYGIPSTSTFIFAVYCIIVLSVSCLMNYRYLPFKRKIPLFAFVIMEGSVALLQVCFRSLLVIGFGTAICILIMYMTLENPDMDMIAKLNEANRRINNLLLNILPASIVAELKEKPSTFTEKYDNITVAFMDIVDFTEMSSVVGAENLVDILNSLFSEFDMLLDNYKIEKIKTIGDAYMIASGLPERYENNCEEMIKFLIQAQRTITNFNKRHNTTLQMRIGVNCGPVVAGIIGKKKFIYDLWGSTVNFACRMQSSGVPDRIQVSQNVYNLMKDKYNFESRETVDVKSFGTCHCYLL